MWRKIWYFLDFHMDMWKTSEFSILTALKSKGEH
jgi:hypothetical protein